MSEREKELKNLLMKEESEKAGLKLNIQETKLLATSPKTYFMAYRWGNGENSGWLYFWGSKITAGGDCSDEIKKRLHLGRKVKTN